MAENVDEGNENDFKENDNVSQESEILRRNRPFIEYFKQEAKILREQGKKVDRIKLGKCFKNLSEEEKAKFRMVGSDTARNKDKEDDFVKGTQKAMETRCAPDRFAKPSMNLSPRDFEYIMGIKDGGVDIDVDLGIDNMSELAVCEKIYVPINDGSAHWYLAVLIVKTQTVEIWDSLPSTTSNSHREEIVRAILRSHMIRISEPY